MNKKKTSKGVTIANVISIVGLVLLLVFTFIGHAYISGGETGWDILVSVGVTALSALLLWFMIKAKGAENQLDKWKIAEYAALGIYIIFAIPASLFGGIMQFFVVNDRKAEIKQYATSDLDNIENVFKIYNDSVGKWISVTHSGLRAAVGDGAERDLSLDRFFTDKGISANQGGVNKHIEIQRNSFIINRESSDGIYGIFKAKRSEIETSVGNWNIIEIPKQAKMLDELASSVIEKVNEKLGDNKAYFPRVTQDASSSKYVLGNNQNNGFKIKEISSSLKFKNELSKGGISITAIAIVLVIHLIILFNYIVAHRTHTYRAGMFKEEDGAKAL
ncbi:MAG: hypothetical protein SOZ80_02415 [Prevotella sp.]|uniref:hypothetical protein n=1 Tax=Prevotella sp. TaxID=59823 RepID=UPI002A2E9243|nr:hypothetical protein [Prevotella sp.]MDD7319103.1 hypothetical protein [Prevotellaceae bacterium]MDY4019622.1 hypothetical protein [Prevotella sp.]